MINIEFKNSLRAGDMLQNGKYLIIKTLGQGHFGITYQCSQTILNKKVVVKEFFIYDQCHRLADHTVSCESASPKVSESFKAKYLEEVKILAKCGTNENIINIFDTFEENNTLYFVTDHLSGEELKKYVFSNENNKLNESEALSIIKQIAKGIDLLHINNIFHLDLCPGKVFITKRGKAVIFEFGISRKDIPAEILSSDMFPDKKGYSPPELDNLNEECGTYSDIYSLGAILYFMLTGKEPPSIIELKGSQLTEPKNLNPLISNNTSKAIMKAMEIAPHARYQRVDDFIGALPYDAKKPLNKRPKKKLIWGISILLMIVFLSAIGINYCKNNSNPDITNQSGLISQSIKLSDLSLSKGLRRGGGIVLKNSNTNDSIVIGTYYALIIGIEKYNGTGFPVLFEAIDDSRKLYTVLTEDYTFDNENVQLTLNPTKAKIYEKLAYYRTRLKQTDNLLVFYAGHGLFDTVSNMGYIIPSDGQRNNISNWISFKNIKDEFFSVIQANHILLITDACQSGSVFRGGDGLPVSVSDNMTMNQLRLKSRYAFTSANLGSVPDKSVFAEQLIRSLKNNKSNVILCQDLFIDVRNSLKDSKSTDDPVRYDELSQCGSEGGDFLFIRRQNPTGKSK